MTQSRFPENDMEPEKSDSSEARFLALTKILSLEQDLGYTDTSVVGGIDQFLEKTISQINMQGESLKKYKINRPQYELLDLEGRKKWVTLTLESLRSMALNNTSEHQTSALAYGIEEERSPSPGQLRHSYTRKKRSSTLSSPNLTKPQKSRKTTSLKTPSSIDDPIEINKRWEKAFQKMGIKSYRDLLWVFPRRYMRVKRISELVDHEHQAIAGTIIKMFDSQYSGRGRKGFVQATIQDKSGSITAVWFGRKWITRSLKKGQQVMLVGRSTSFRGKVRFNVESQEQISTKSSSIYGSILPIYPLSEGITQRTMRNLIENALEYCLPLIEDYLPPQILAEENLPALDKSIKMIHNPQNLEEQEKARNRISFDEVLMLQLGLLKRKQNQQKELGTSISTNEEVLDAFVDRLPFTLTKDQKKSISEIGSDMKESVPMMRLLQGDVGSGKTVVAAASLVVAAASGYQGALMAPTEVLAEQHFKTLTDIFSQGTREEDDGGPYRGFSGVIPNKTIKVSLLTGSMPSGVKTSIQHLIRNGEVDIAIGTHALIQKDVGFRSLGLAVVDEQHRFGVNQRASLREKGMSPHLLVMTATPIPRTLSLALYGDLDVTTISEMPPGRPAIKTKALFPQEREKAHNFIRKEVEKGHQAFIICPLVEESESIEAKAAIEEHGRLQKNIFPDLSVGLLHGRMKSSDKEAVISQFRNGDLQILVSTAVIEVGIDIPNATVMMVEGAERFGLSQLHQYRGRVGRGKNNSYCILVSDSESPEVRDRLNIMEQTDDGFKLSEADLQMRGPGEFFGTKQSGIPDLSLTWISDLEFIENIRSRASNILDSDPQLKTSSHKNLSNELNRFWERAKETPEGG